MGGVETGRVGRGRDRKGRRGRDRKGREERREEGKVRRRGRRW